MQLLHEGRDDRILVPVALDGQEDVKVNVRFAEGPVPKDGYGVRDGARNGLEHVVGDILGDAGSTGSPRTETGSPRTRKGL